MQGPGKWVLVDKQKASGRTLVHGRVPCTHSVLTSLNRPRTVLGSPGKFSSQN